MARLGRRERASKKIAAFIKVKVSRAIAVNLGNMANIIEEHKMFNVDAYGGARENRDPIPLGATASVQHVFMPDVTVPFNKPQTCKRFAEN